MDTAAALFRFTVDPLELVLRGTAVYWGLFLLFRFLLRRDTGSLGIADILLLVPSARRPRAMTRCARPGRWRWGVTRLLDHLARGHWHVVRVLRAEANSVVAQGSTACTAADLPGLSNFLQGLPGTARTRRWPWRSAGHYTARV